MGYTNYWGFKKIAKSKLPKIEKLYSQAISDCNGVIALYQSQAEDWERLSGYSAHAPYKYNGIKINGKDSESCEDFILRATYAESERDFCKTNQRSYDIAVKACLIILKKYLGTIFDWSCDSRNQLDHAQQALFLVNKFYNERKAA